MVLPSCAQKRQGNIVLWPHGECICLHNVHTAAVHPHSILVPQILALSLLDLKSAGLTTVCLNSGAWRCDRIIKFWLSNSSCIEKIRKECTETFDNLNSCWDRVQPPWPSRISGWEPMHGCHTALSYLLVLQVEMVLYCTEESYERNSGEVLGTCEEAGSLWTSLELCSGRVLVPEIFFPFLILNCSVSFNDLLNVPPG